MFAQPQRLRRFAVHVLLFWLFGLGTGVVNACVMQTGMVDGTAAVAQANADPEQHADPAQMLQADADDHECDHTRPPCERLCDGPSAVPQAEKQHSNPLSGFWLAAAPIPSFNFQSRAEPPGTLASAHERRRTTVPIPIAFLRLAL